MRKSAGILRKRHQTVSLCGFLSDLKNSEHLHAFLYPNKVVSTIPHPPRGWAPFLSRKELRSACFPFTSFRILAFLQKCYSQNPPADWLCKICPSNLLPFFYAPSRESALDFCQPLNLSFAASPHIPFHQFSNLSCSPLQFSRQ